MATTIQIKRGSGVPGVALADGEMAWDHTNHQLYVGDGSINTLVGSGTTYTADESTLHLAAGQFSIMTSYPGQTSIVTVGTIATGTWQATAVDETHGGTHQTSYTLGDILYASAANTLAKLPGNTSLTRKFLSDTGTGSVSAAPVWDTLATTDFSLSLIQYILSFMSLFVYIFGFSVIFLDATNLLVVAGGGTFA
jgi:hypothetical protein